MVTENTPYRNKKYIVEDIRFDSKFKTDDERVSKLFDEVQNYMGVYLTSLEYCNNRPHPLTAFK